MRITSPVVSLANIVGGGVRGAAESFGQMVSARARNIKLEQELERAHVELDRNREAALENERLRQLLEMRQELVPRAIGASVVTTALGAQTRMIVVDRGTDAGVRPDLAVIAWGGAVGRVTAATKYKSRVQLLTDPNSGAAGVVQRSRAQGMVIGLGEQRLSMLYVPGFSDVSHGDRVVTSGLDGIFPRGIGIGTVATTQENPDGSKSIELMPEVDFRHLEEVLILLDPLTSDLLAPSAAESEAP